MELRAGSDQQEWEQACHDAVTSDVIWRLDAYRAALFLLHLSRDDCRTLNDAHHLASAIDQLTRAVGSISANLAEGYSRATRPDRLRFLGYALSSTRESVTWYLAATGDLPEAALDHRLKLLMRIRALLLGLIRAIRNQTRTGNFES
jgi:four helix bundle protein